MATDWDAEQNKRIAWGRAAERARARALALQSALDAIHDVADAAGPGATCKPQLQVPMPPDHIADVGKMVAGVTVEEVAHVVWSHLGKNGCLDACKIERGCGCATELATALLPLLDRARLAGFAEGIEAAAADTSEVAASWEHDAFQAMSCGDSAGRHTALVVTRALRDRVEAIRSLAPVSRDDGWQPIETAPRDGQKLLVARKGYGHGGWVRMIASFIPKHTEESIEDYAEYDEASDTYFTPEGWYEQCYEHDEWSSIRMSTDPLKWRALPAPPAQGGE